MADLNPMLMAPDQRRRYNAMLMAEQYGGRTPSYDYDFQGAPLSPAIEAFKAQRGQPGVIQKTLGLVPGFDQSGKRGEQSWTNALMSTAQFPIDMILGAGQAITAPARAYIGEFDPTSEQGIGEALNVAGTAMTGGLAAPKPINTVGMFGGRLAKTAEPSLNVFLDRMQRPSPEPATEALSRFVSGTPEPIIGYRGSATSGNTFKNRNHVFASSDPSNASQYALDPWVTYKGTEPSPSVMPMEFRFKNPMKVDAKGGAYDAPGLNPEDLLHTAATRGNDGLIISNYVDPPYAGAPTSDPQTTIAAIKRGTVYSPLTGDLLYANGGRPGGAVGAALQASNDPALNELLRKYGIDLPRQSWSNRMLPGDA